MYFLYTHYLSRHLSVDR